MPAPPTSRRICVNCDKERTFKYNRTIGHSECMVCGFRFGIKIDPNAPKPEPVIEVKKKKESKPQTLITLNIESLKKRIETGSKVSRKKARRILKVLEKFDFRCAGCGATENLTMAHTSKKLKNKSRILCSKCNIEVHQEKIKKAMSGEENGRQERKQ